MNTSPPQNHCTFMQGSCPCKACTLPPGSTHRRFRSVQLSSKLGRTKTIKAKFRVAFTCRANSAQIRQSRQDSGRGLSHYSGQSPFASFRLSPPRPAAEPLGIQPPCRMTRVNSHCACGLISPCSGRDCVQSLWPSYMGLYPQSTATSRRAVLC